MMSSPNNDYGSDEEEEEEMSVTLEKEVMEQEGVDYAMLTVQQQQENFTSTTHQAHLLEIKDTHRYLPLPSHMAANNAGKDLNAILEP